MRRKDDRLSPLSDARLAVRPSDDPFGIQVEIASCPWNPAHRLALVGIKAREIPVTRRPPMNLVFLIDVSGSMQPANKLPLIKQALWWLTQQLTENDRVAIVTYSNGSQLALASTSGADRDAILAAVNKLEANGSTNGGEAIQTAYRAAAENFIRNGVNRVILCTDGDFNVGITQPDALFRLIETEAKRRVFLSVFGFGTGNLKDATMEQLADRGNGNYAHIDALEEARKVFTEKLSSTLVAVAKDVKVQIEFNPARAQAYQAQHAGRRDHATAELLTLKLRYKPINSDTSRLLSLPVTDRNRSIATASEDLRFAAAVAGLGMILRDSEFRNDLDYNAIIALAAAARGTDPNGERAEFITLVQRATSLTR